MKIEIVNKIEIKIDNQTLVLSKFEVKQLIKQLQAAVGDKSPEFSGQFTYSPGVRAPINPYEIIRNQMAATMADDANLERYGPQEAGSSVAFDRGV